MHLTIAFCENFSTMFQTVLPSAQTHPQTALQSLMMFGERDQGH